MELETAIGDELGLQAAVDAAMEPTHADRELLDRLIADLTVLIQSPEGRWSKRNLNAFTDALKRVDYVVLGGNHAEA